LNEIHILGKYPMYGELAIQGSKNAVLPLMAASLLHRGITELDHVPEITDVACMVRILERLNMGAVTGAYLCSVPLGGKLVELPLQEGVRCPVSVLRPDGRGYDPCIAQAGGAHGFSLLLDGKEVTLTDSRGNTGTQFKMCRRFAEGVSLWLKERYPAADCSVDMTNAGSVVVLKRLLNTMKRVLPADEWKRLEIRWNT